MEMDWHNHFSVSTILKPKAEVVGILTSIQTLLVYSDYNEAVLSVRQIESAVT